MIFKDFIGNEKVKEFLAGQIDKNKLHNTIIIEGEKGLGKKTLANIIATAAVCKGDDKPCGKCSGCIKAKAGSHPDILRFSPQDGRTKINSDEAREIKNKAFIIPNEAEKNIIIIESVDKMEEKTQNMLLKVLEDTPDRTTFILLCNSKENILETVLSRGTLLTLGGVDVKSAADEAMKKCSGSSLDDALIAAKIANGNIGETIALLNDKKLKDNITLACDILKESISGNYEKLISLPISSDKDKLRFKAILEISQIVLKDALLISAGVDFAPLSDVSKFLSDRLKKKYIENLYDGFSDILRKLEKSGNIKLLRAKCVILLSNKGDV
jgi:DNA polymerase III delta prime subunit